MARGRRSNNLDSFLLGIGSLMDISGESARHTSRRRLPRRRRSTSTVIASYWSTVGRYLSQAVDSYSNPEADRR